MQIFMSCKVQKFHFHAAALAFLCLVAAAGAVPHYVRPPGTCTNTDLQFPYDSWDKAATQILWAVNAATDSETVWVTNGAYFLTNEVIVTSNITLRSVSGWTNTLVAADWPNYTTRCFYVTRTGTVDGFTVSNGHNFSTNSDSQGGGGAYLATEGKIINCYFTRNICSNRNSSSLDGGGVHLNGSATLSNCLFVSNTCLARGYGGAVQLPGGGRIFNCTFISNTAVDSAIWGKSFVASNCLIAFNYNGGVYAENAVVSHSVISNNIGGIAASIGNRTGFLKNSVVVNNVGTYPAVFLSYGGVMSNTVVAGNRSTSFAGGGVQISASQYTDTCSWVENCWISNNVSQANAGGGGVYITNRGGMKNCVINNNTNLSAGGLGGGILAGNACGRSDLRHGIINCTIVNNYSVNEGGGAALHGESNLFINCIMAGNTSSSGNYPNVFFYTFADVNRHNFSNCCAVITNAYYLAEDQGNITNAPIYSASYPWRPAPNSPCLNRGLNQGWMLNANDLSGGPRIRYGTVDIGALEGIYDCSLFTIH